MARLPDISERNDLAEGERWVYDDMMRTRGRILPGYAPLLHCAELVGRVVNVGSYFRFDASLPPRTLEVIALTVSTELGDRYEQAVHHRGALAAGLESAVADAICAGTDVAAAEAADAMVIAGARELVRSGKLDEPTFAGLREGFGDRGVVEVVTAIGFYAMLAYMHNAVGIAPAEGAAPAAR